MKIEQAIRIAKRRARTTGDVYSVVYDPSDPMSGGRSEDCFVVASSEDLATIYDYAQDSDIVFSTEDY